MSLKLLTNGLFSRSLVVETGERGERQPSLDVSEIPRSLVEIARWWKEYNPAPVDPATGRKPNLNDEHPTPAIVPYTDEGYATMEQFADLADEEYNAAHTAGDRVRAVIWTRACENATRLALVYACSRDHLSPRIDTEVARWASTFTNHLVRHMLKQATQRVAANPFHGECLTLLRTLRQAGGRMLRRDLMRAMHAKAFDFNQMIGTLLEQGDVLPWDIPTKTKTATGYQLP